MSHNTQQACWWSTWTSRVSRPTAASSQNCARHVAHSHSSLVINYMPRFPHCMPYSPIRSDALIQFIKRDARQRLLLTPVRALIPDSRRPSVASILALRFRTVSVAMARQRCLPVPVQRRRAMLHYVVARCAMLCRGALCCTGVHCVAASSCAGSSAVLVRSRGCRQRPQPSVAQRVLTQLSADCCSDEVPSPKCQLPLVTHQRRTARPPRFCVSVRRCAPSTLRRPCRLCVAARVRIVCRCPAVAPSALFL